MTAKAAAPFVMIENSVINDRLRDIGPYGFTVYAVIKSYRNRKTERCDPSYATIAEKAGIDRVTVIRYVKVLKSFNLLDPQLRFKEDGSASSNQYNFSSSPGTPATPKKSATAETPPDLPIVTPAQPDTGGCAEQPPAVVQNNHPGCSGETTPGCTAQPEQSSSSNKRERTSPDIASLPTEKQKTCPHPPEEIAHLSDDITLCHHCWLLLDDNLTVAEEPAASLSDSDGEIVGAIDVCATIPPQTAFPECDPDSSGEPEEKTPPVGNPTTTALETPQKNGTQKPPDCPRGGKEGEEDKFSGNAGKTDYRASQEFVRGGNENHQGRLESGLGNYSKSPGFHGSSSAVGEVSAERSVIGVSGGS